MNVLLFQCDTHQGEVVVGVGACTMLLYGGLELVDDLAGREALGVGHQLQQAGVAQQLFLLVLGFVVAGTGTWV